MKQKIVIKIPMHDDKCHSRAMRVAAKIRGVETVRVVWEEVVVIGDGIDSAKLLRRLKKKFGHSELVSAGVADDEQPSTAAEPPVLGVVAPPFYGLPHFHHCEIREPPSCNPCTIL